MSDGTEEEQGCMEDSLIPLEFAADVSARETQFADPQAESADSNG